MELWSSIVSRIGTIQWAGQYSGQGAAQYCHGYANIQFHFHGNFNLLANFNFHFSMSLKGESDNLSPGAVLSWSVSTQGRRLGGKTILILGAHKAPRRKGAPDKSPTLTLNQTLDFSACK